MGNATPQPRFPSEVWDGTTPSTPNILNDKVPDTEFGARYRAEIIALEQVLAQYTDLLEKIKNYGVGNSILGVRDDGIELEYKTLIEGSGITIAHTAGGITISSSVVVTESSATADVDITYGNPLRMKSDGHVEKAQADAESTSHVVGIATATVTAGNTCTYSTSAVTLVDWTAIAGTALLTPGATYFLSSATAGMITSTAPTTPGEYVVRIGRAQTITRLNMEIDWPIFL